MSETATFDLSKFGFVSQDEIAQSAWARLLVIGRPKIGKSTAIVGTAPGPVAVLNADGDSALKYPAGTGAKFLQFDVGTRETWRAGRKAVTAAAQANAVRTVVVDTITFLADALYDEISLKLDGHERFGELKNQIVGGLKQLFQIPAHVIVIAHLLPGKDDGSEGIMPLINGQSKFIVPGIANDVVMFDYQAGRTPERQFIVGPQGSWTYGGRNISRKTVTNPTIPELFKELKIQP